MPKISNFTPSTSIVATDIVAGVVGGDSESITAEQILMVKSLTATRWDDIRVPVTATRREGSKDPDFSKISDDAAGTSQGVFAELFDKSTEQELYFSLQVPHDWKIGTNLHAHVHWCPTDTDTGTIQWGLEWSLAAIGGVIGNTTISLGTATAAPGVAYQHSLFEIAEIDMSAITSVSSMIMCRIFRNVSGDSYDNDAAMLEIDFHYEKDSLGSASEYVK